MKRCLGFTLVESLVALVLLSLGLLGALGMLLGSLRTQSDALLAKSAATLVSDMAERIRANPRAGSGYDSSRVTPQVAECTSTSPCTVEQLAASDLAHFAAASGRLPLGLAEVVYEPAIGPAAADRYAITVRWRSARDDETNVVALNLLAPPVAG